MAIITELPTDQSPPHPDASALQTGDTGFLGSLVGSILEPGVNKALFQAMNFSFLALILTLGGMAVLTSYNTHVLFLMAVSTGLWVTMVWFVAEISKVQTQPQNAPPAVPSDADADAGRSGPPPPSIDLLSSADPSAPTEKSKTSATQDPEIRHRKP